MRPKQTAQAKVVTVTHPAPFDNEKRRFIRASARYWDKTGVPEGIARQQDLAARLDKGELSLAELHQAWCRTYNEMLDYSGAAIHGEAKTTAIRKLLDERERVMTELFRRMTALEKSLLEKRPCRN